MFRHAGPWFALVATLSICALARPAWAQEPRSADALFDEGSALLKAGKVGEACSKLAESQSIEPAIGTLGLLAYCHEQSGLLATALREYGEVAELSHLAAQAAREKVARERVASLASHVTRLAVVLPAPADQLEVYLDARRLGASELGASTPVDPGSFELRVSGPGLVPWRQALTIPADGSTLRVVVPQLQPQVAPKAAAAPPPATTRPAERRAHSPAVWASFGAGSLGVAVGSYFGLAAIAARSDANPHCQGNRCDQIGVDARERAIDRARISTIAFTVGALGAATGVVLILTDRREEPRQRAAVSALPGGAAVSWERRF